MLQYPMIFAELLHRTGLIAAHRGNRALAPENTMLAFEKSVGVCDFVELDVQLSRDGVLVVVHDDTLERTSNIAAISSLQSRKPWRVCDLTLAELQTLDAGEWFYESDPFGSIATGGTDRSAPSFQTIPTLEAVLHFLQQHHLPVNVELKTMAETHEDAVVVQALLKVLQTARSEELVLVSSFYHPYLKRLKQLAPKIATAALQEGEHPVDLVEYLHTLGVEGYHMDDAIATPEVVAKLRHAGVFVGVYTVNDPSRQETLFRWGVNAVFTDRPTGAIAGVS